MKRKRHTPEQIVGHLRDAEAMESEGKTIARGQGQVPSRHCLT